jgi:hypothetical protein
MLVSFMAAASSSLWNEQRIVTKGFVVALLAWVCTDGLKIRRINFAGCPLQCCERLRRLFAMSKVATDIDLSEG